MLLALPLLDETPIFLVFILLDDIPELEESIFLAFL